MNVANYHVCVLSPYVCIVYYALNCQLGRRLIMVESAWIKTLIYFHKQPTSPVRNGSEVYIWIQAKVFNFACVCNTCITGVFCHHHDTVLYFSICQKDIWSNERYKIYGPLTQACLTLGSNHFHSCSSLQNIKPVRCGQMWLRDNSNRDSTAWRLPSLWMWYVQWKWKYF